MRAEDRRMIFEEAAGITKFIPAPSGGLIPWGYAPAQVEHLAPALERAHPRSHSAISPSVRPQPVQTLELVSSSQICLQGDGGRSIRSPEVDAFGISFGTQPAIMVRRGQMDRDDPQMAIVSGMKPLVPERQLLPVSAGSEVQDYNRRTLRSGTQHPAMPLRTGRHAGGKIRSGLRQFGEKAFKGLLEVDAGKGGMHTRAQ